MTLVGADTILAQEQALAAAPRPGPLEGGPLLAVVDSRGRVDDWVWEALRDVAHWSEFSLCTPRPPRLAEVAARCRSW
ncbi:hypothetical protein [Rhodococcus opacus]|uniref:hypothetical protein n=1 Tax=Rhodococcus opacus TaxID=37919 RepID=UPI001F547264|nr:hypothetical protein [Rhodococcus opacus]